jgi:cytidylate kinase
MAESRDRLTAAERERIYQEEIRPLHLAVVERSTAPTVIFVGGAPGSGKTGAVPPVAAELEKRSGIPVIVSVDDLREHHPGWRRDARTDAHAAERFDVDASEWFNRLYRDAIAERANVVLVTRFKDAQLLTDTVAEFRAAGYRAEAVILAVDEQRTRRGVIGRYLHAQETGQLPRLVTATSHHEGYAGLRRTVQKAESARLVDQIRVVRRDGTEIYRNHLVDGQWQKERGAVDAVDAERDRPLTPAEKVDNAIAWHQLTVRAQRNEATPEDVIHQSLVWRKDASQRALADPEAAKQYGWKLAGEAFTTMPREQFLQEFPAYAGAVERMDKAVEHAKTHYAIEQNQIQFIAAVRARIAQQIEEGRQFGRIKKSDRDLHASVAKTIDEGRSR